MARELGSPVPCKFRPKFVVLEQRAHPPPTQFCAAFTHTAAALLFCICAALQINDPDPVIWIGMYLCGGVVPALYAARQAFQRVPEAKSGMTGAARALAAALPAALLAAALPTVVVAAITGAGSGSKHFFYSEAVREASGCFVVLFWLALGPSRGSKVSADSTTEFRAILVALCVAALGAWRGVLQRKIPGEIPSHCSDLLAPAK